MILAGLGCALLALDLFIGWFWLLPVGLGMMLVGLMFSYRPPQDDPVWRLLLRDGVIDEHGNKPPP